MFALHAGSHKHFGRRGPTHGLKDVDGSAVIGEGKHSRRAAGYNSHEVVGLKHLDANFDDKYLYFLLLHVLIIRGFSW